MTNYCTVFDRNYLTRGLALYSSLEKHAGKFRLWVLCMDETVFEILGKMRLKNMELIKLSDFEDKDLLKVKPTRNFYEYIWTCASSIPLYLFKNYKDVKMVVYLDSDLFFYSSPKPIYDEFGKNSIMIIPHRFASGRKEKEKGAGKYNVSMLIFRRDANSQACLKWWRSKVIDWCYDRQEDGKVGDQKYLDEFPKRFKKVHILRHVGANVAPWNIRQYRVWENNGKIFINNSPLIFYHYLRLKLYPPAHFLMKSPLTNYGELTLNRKLIYNQYFDEVYVQAKNVSVVSSQFNYGFVPRFRSIQYWREETMYQLIRIKNAI